MPEFNLIKIEGKPLEKLIDVISKGIGTLYKPRSIRKEADAKAYEIKILEEARNKAKSESKISEAETYLRIQDRILFKELERQNNIDSISEKAAEQLGSEESVSEEPVEDEWTKRFFNIAQDISDEDLQDIWSRILSGEVMRPGSFSLRTLELLKNLTKKEAEVFNQCANFTIISFNKPFIYRGKSGFLDKYGCGFENRLLLIELGLLLSESNITRTIPENKTDHEIKIYHESGSVLLKQIIRPNSPKKPIPIFRFSKIGEELLKIIIVNSNIEYLKEFALNNTDQHTEFEYAYILENNGNANYQVTLPWNKITAANN